MLKACQDTSNYFVYLFKNGFILPSWNESNLSFLYFPWFIYYILNWVYELGGESGWNRNFFTLLVFKFFNYYETFYMIFLFANDRYSISFIWYKISHFQALIFHTLWIYYNRFSHKYLLMNVMILLLYFQKFV